MFWGQLHINIFQPDSTPGVSVYQEQEETSEEDKEKAKVSHEKPSHHHRIDLSKPVASSGIELWESRSIHCAGCHSRYLEKARSWRQGKGSWLGNDRRISQKSSRLMIMFIPLCDRVSFLRRGDPGTFAIWFASILHLDAVDGTQVQIWKRAESRTTLVLCYPQQESRERKGARPERLQRAQEEFSVISLIGGANSFSPREILLEDLKRNLENGDSLAQSILRMSNCFVCK